MFKKYIFITFLLSLSLNAFSADLTFIKLFKDGKSFYSIGGALGGDPVIVTTEGDELNGGDAFTFNYGRDARFSDRSKRFIRLSIGYKYGFLRADNGTATITAIPINALYMQQNAKFVYGAGLSLHLSPTVKAPGFSESESLELGFTGQAAYRLSKAQELGVVFDSIDYGSASANALGIFYTKRFGAK